jgi:hypothetical protein
LLPLHIVFFRFRRLAGLHHTNTSRKQPVADDLPRHMGRVYHEAVVEIWKLMSFHFLPPPNS